MKITHSISLKEKISNMLLVLRGLDTKEEINFGGQIGPKFMTFPAEGYEAT